MDSLEHELKEINKELTIVDDELKILMSRKSNLLSKAKRLQEKIEKLKHVNSCDNTDEPCSSIVLEKRSPYEDKEQINKVIKLFKIERLRDFQKQVLDCCAQKEDCLVIMPTGAGKSLCYQLPTFFVKGFTLVISPLVSLMEDQIESLHRIGIESAVFINAFTPQTVQSDIHKIMQEPKQSETYKLIYVTPEKLAKSKKFMSSLQKAYEAGLVNRFAIDEVHCCSQWGHDFRKDYKFLHVLRRQFPLVPILGVTATATNSVLEDVQNILGISDAVKIQSSFNRANLNYEVIDKPGSNPVELLHKMILSKYHRKSGIVYCLSQKESEDVAMNLQSLGIKAACYHANINPKGRSDIHKRWTNGRLHVIVATIAFGMGIDKPNVSFVIHFTISKSLENYYQESGRAGRNNQDADCIIMWRFSDLFRISSMVLSEQTGMSKLYLMASYCLDRQKCRRHILADSFDEAYRSEMCQSKCDNCRRNTKDTQLEYLDISKVTVGILDLLRHQTKKGQPIKITGAKLVDLLMSNDFVSKYSLSLPISLGKTLQDRYGYLVIWLILHEYLKEDFLFTSYTTISYTVSGPKAYLVENEKNNWKIKMPVLTNVMIASDVKTASVSPDNVSSQIESNDRSDYKESSNLTTSDNDYSVIKKRKLLSQRVESDSNSSDEEFDFGKRAKLSKLLKPVHQDSRHSSVVTICIEDSN